MNDEKCARCGKYCSGGCFTDHQIIKTHGNCVGDNLAVYLCEDCQQQLEEWLNLQKQPKEGKTINETEYMTLSDEYLLDAIVELGGSLRVKDREIRELLAQIADLQKNEERGVLWVPQDKRLRFGAKKKKEEN